MAKFPSTIQHAFSRFLKTILLATWRQLPAVHSRSRLYVFLQRTTHGPPCRASVWQLCFYVLYVLILELHQSHLTFSLFSAFPVSMFLHASVRRAARVHARIARTHACTHARTRTHTHTHTHTHTQIHTHTHTHTLYALSLSLMIISKNRIIQT